MNDYVDFIVKCYFKFARQRDENFKKIMISTFFRPKNRQNLPYSTFSCFFRYLSKMTQMTHDPPGGHERYHKYLSKMSQMTHDPPG